MISETSIKSPAELLSNGNVLAGIIINEANEVLKKQFKRNTAVVFSVRQFPDYGNTLANVRGCFEAHNWSVVSLITSTGLLWVFSDPGDIDVELRNTFPDMHEELIALLLEQGWEIKSRTTGSVKLTRPDVALWKARQVLFDKWSQHKKTRVEITKPD